MSTIDHTDYTPSDFSEPEVSETIDFTDTSIRATEWLWDFGDGETSTERHPSHTYTVVGEYQVTLTVSNEWGSDEIIQIVTIVQSDTETDDDNDDDDKDDDNDDDDKDDDIDDDDKDDDIDDDDKDDDNDNPIVQVRLNATPEDGWVYDYNNEKSYTGFYHLHRDGTAMIGEGVLGASHTIDPNKIILQTNTDGDGELTAAEYRSLIESGWTTTQGQCSVEQKQRGCRHYRGANKCVCPPKAETAE